MSNYSKLKAAIRQVIKQNGNNEITGDLLQQTLLSMVNTLGEGRMYMGIAILQTTPPITDGNVFYIASKPGIYSGFGGKEVKKGTIGIFTNIGVSWDLASIDLSNFGVQMTEDAALQTKDKTIIGAINEVNKTAQDAQPKAPNKGLSTNDFTNDYKEKVDNALLKTKQVLTTEEQKQVLSNIGAQSKTDSTLNTEDKTVVGAINENNQLAKDAVLKTEQELTSEEQTQVQLNIGVKGTIDVVGAGEAQQVPVDMAHDGKFINFENKLIQSESIYFISNPIRVRKGDIITGNIWATSRISVITQVDSTGNIIETLLRGSTDENTNVNYVCDRDMHICFSARKDRFTIQIRPCKLAGGIVSSRTSLRPLYEATGAVYKEEKGVWLLNGLELTNDEMAEVYSFGNLSNSNGSNWSNRLAGYRGKTTIPYNHQLGQLLKSSLNLDGAFALCKNLEILRISTIIPVFPESVNFLLYDSPKLRIVENIIKMSGCKKAERFAFGAASLESIKLEGVLISLSFSDSPLLTVEDTEDSTLGYLVANAENTAPITVTLHADAYARVPESLKTKAQEKQISIVSA